MPPQGQAPTEKPKKPWYKKWWIWVIVGVVLIGSYGAANGGSSSKPDIKPVPVQEKPAEVAPTPKPEPEPAKPAEPDVPAEFKSALKKAQIYSDTMAMSQAGLYQQLTSEYGEKFSPEAAQYAIDNVNADWNANALKKAQTYQEMMSMSPEAIRDQLTSEYGEQFTQEQADYAIANL